MKRPRSNHLNLGTLCALAFISGCWPMAAAADPTINCDFSPQSGLTAPANISFTATVNSPEGNNIARVEYFNAADISAPFGTAFSAPYFASRQFQAGSYGIICVVTDDTGAFGTDTHINFTVDPGGPSNSPPQITNMTPQNGATFNADGSGQATVNFTVSVFDPDAGDTINVPYYDTTSGGEVPLGFGSGSNFALSIPFGVGPHTVRAYARDSQGAEDHRDVSFTVNQAQNNAPVLNFVAPSEGAVFSTTDNITFTVNAVDNDPGDFVTGVDFYDATNGLIPLGSSSSGPNYTIQHQFNTAQPYTIRASATDNHGKFDTRDLHITVNAPATTPVLTNISAHSINVLENKTIIFTGSNFIPGTSVVQLWDVFDSGQIGSNITPNPGGTSTSFSATIVGPWPTADYHLRVSNGPGGISQGQILTSAIGQPTLTAVTPNTGSAGQNQTVTLTGTYFYPNGVTAIRLMQPNGITQIGSDIPPLFAPSSDGTSMQAQIPVPATGGTYKIVVFNSGPGGGLSTAQTFISNANCGGANGNPPPGTYALSGAPPATPFTITFLNTGLNAPGAPTTYNFYYKDPSNAIIPLANVSNNGVSDPFIDFDDLTPPGNYAFFMDSNNDPNWKWPACATRDDTSTWFKTYTLGTLNVTANPPGSQTGQPASAYQRPVALTLNPGNNGAANISGYYQWYKNRPPDQFPSPAGSGLCFGSGGPDADVASQPTPIPGANGYQTIENIASVGPNNLWLAVCVRDTLNPNYDIHKSTYVFPYVINGAGLTATFTGTTYPTASNGRYKKDPAGNFINILRLSVSGNLVNIKGKWLDTAASLPTAQQMLDTGDPAIFTPTLENPGSYKLAPPASDGSWILAVYLKDLSTESVVFVQNGGQNSVVVYDSLSPQVCGRITATASASATYCDSCEGASINPNGAFGRCVLNGQLLGWLTSNDLGAVDCAARQPPEAPGCAPVQFDLMKTVQIYTVDLDASGNPNGSGLQTGTFTPQVTLNTTPTSATPDIVPITSGLSYNYPDDHGNVIPGKTITTPGQYHICGSATDVAGNVNSRFDCATGSKIDFTFKSGAPRPNNLKAVVNPTQRDTLDYTWSMPTNTSGVTEYRLCKDTDCSAPLTTLPGNATTFKVSYKWGVNVQGSATVIACGDAACSSQLRGTTITATHGPLASTSAGFEVYYTSAALPTAPVSANVNADGSVDINWTDGGNPGYTIYTIEYKTGATTRFINSVPPATNFKIDRLTGGLIANSAYTYKISANVGNDTQNGPQPPSIPFIASSATLTTAQMTFFTAPGTPNPPTLDNTGTYTTTSIPVQFSFATTPQNPSGTVYHLRASPDSNFATNVIEDTGDTTYDGVATSAKTSMNGLQAGVPYFIRVCALSKKPGATMADAACSQSAGPFSTKFTQPNTLSVQNDAAINTPQMFQIKVGQMNGELPTCASVKWANGPTAGAIVKDLTPQTGVFVLNVAGNGVTANTSFSSFQIGFGGNGCTTADTTFSGYSPILSGGPAYTKAEKPQPPTGITINNASAQLTATVAVGNGNPTTTAHSIEAIPQSSTDWSTALVSNNPASRTTAGTLTIPGIATGTSYQVRVRAKGVKPGDPNFDGVSDTQSQAGKYSKPIRAEIQNEATDPNNTSTSFVMSVFQVNGETPKCILLKFTNNPNPGNASAFTLPAPINGIYSVIVNGMPSNTRFSGFSAGFGETCPVPTGAGDQKFSDFASLSPQDAYTKAAKPLSPTGVAIDNATNKLTANITIPPQGLNPANTQHFLEALPVGQTDWDQAYKSAALTASGVATINGIATGTNYQVRVRAKSIKNDEDFDGISNTQNQTGKFTNPNAMNSPNDAAVNTENMFQIKINQVAAETPSCALIKFTNQPAPTGIIVPSLSSKLVNGVYVLNLDVGLKSNTMFNNFQIGFGNSCTGTNGASDPTFSDLTTFDPTNPAYQAWTKAAKPTPPTNVTIDSIAFKLTANVTISPANLPSTAYSIEAIPDSATDWTNPLTSQGPPSRTTSGPLTISGVAGGTSYQVRVRAKSGYNSTFDGVSDTQTQAGRFSKPTILSPHNDAEDARVTASTFFIQTNQVNGELPTCALIKFTNSSSPNGIIFPLPAPNNGMYDLVLAGLPNTKFSDFKIGYGETCAGLNGIGDTKFSDFANLSGEAWTKPLAPGSPSNATVDGARTLTATLTTASNPTTTDYRLEAALNSGSGGPDWNTALKSSTRKDNGTLTIPNLLPASNYLVRAVAISAKNDTAFDAPSIAIPVASRFTAPTVINIVNDAAINDSSSFHVKINRVGTESPACVLINFNSGSTPKSFTTSNIDGSASVIDVTVDGQTSNTSFTNFKAGFGSNCNGTDGAADQMFSGFATNATVGGAPGWTKPSKSNPPTITAETTNSLTGNFDFPSNPPVTKYTPQAVPIIGGQPDLNSLIPATADVTQGPGNSGPITISGLLSGQSYAMRVVSRSNYTQSFDVESDLSNIVSTKKLAPTAVSVDNAAAVTTESTFRLKVRPNPNDTIPAAWFVHVTYDYKDDAGATKSDEFYSQGLSLDPQNFLLVDVGPGHTNPGNTEYTNIKARLGSSRTPTDSSWSDFTPTADHGWTLPAAPTSGFKTVDVAFTSVLATINFPTTNSAQTFYKIQMVKDPTHFDNTLDPSDPVRETNPVQFGQDPSPIQGLDALTNYYIRTYVISNSPYTLNFDVKSPVAGPVKTGSPKVNGSIVNVYVSSATARWDLSLFANTGTLQAGTTSAVGAPVGQSEVLTGPFSAPLPTITVTNLPEANTSYTMFLQKTLPNDTNLITYDASQISFVTLADVPVQPGLDISGSQPNFDLTIILDPSGASRVDKNSSGSLYAIEIASNTQPAKYLDGAGGLSATKVWKTRDEWKVGNALTLNNAGMFTIYTVRLIVKQISPLAPTPEVASLPTIATMPGGAVSITLDQIVGQDIDNFLFGVQLAKPFVANFSTNMDPTAFANQVTLKRIDNGASIPVTVDYQDVSGLHQLTITPAGLEASTAYELFIPAGLKDKWGFATGNSFGPKRFFTSVDPNTVSKVYSPYDAQHANYLTVEKSAITGGAFVVMRLSPYVSPQFPVTSGTPLGVDSLLSSNKALRIAKQVEVLFYNLDGSGNPQRGDAAKAVSLTLSANAGGSGAPGILGSQVDAGSLNIYLYDKSQGLVPVPNARNNGDGTVTVPAIAKSGVYVLAGAIPTNLSASYAYPVPYKPSTGHTFIYFRNLAPDTTIKVFTIMGELVKELHADGTVDPLPWDVKNTDGDNVASGVYLYQIKNSFSEKRGKLMVIR